jgi:PAS domain S-box-containing protein
MVLEKTVQERTVELRESEARFRALTELSTDWYWESDENLRITTVSGPVLDMLGIRIGASIDEAILFPGSDWNEAERAGLEASMKARTPFVDVPFGRVNADGSRQFFRASGEPIFDRSCRFVGYRGVGVEVLATGLEPASE